jgi:hypothetical protein
VPSGKSSCVGPLFPAEIRADVRASVAASLAGEPRLDIGKANIVRPSVSADRYRVAAFVFRAIDQRTTSARSPISPKVTFRWRVRAGIAHDLVDRPPREAAGYWASAFEGHNARGTPVGASDREQAPGHSDPK